MLPKLLELEVPQKVGKNYEKFGIILLNDKDGTIVAVIENDANFQSEKIVRKILKNWIQGMGKEVTWKSLIRVLNTCEIFNLAKRIQASLVYNH